MTDQEMPFEADDIDEQIDLYTQMLRATPAKEPPAPDLRLIDDLQQFYPADEAAARSLARVRQRLLSSAPSTSQEGQQAGPSDRLSSLAERRQPMRVPQSFFHAGQRMSYRVATIAAAVLLVVVISGLVAGLVLVRQRGPGVANPPPGSSEIAYIGSDGNVWEMAWPGGTPKQLTADAQASGISYSGLAWSPDGAKIAVARFNQNNPPQGSELMVLAPDGKVMLRVGIEALRYDAPLAWSPDGRQIAYRAESPQASFDNPEEEIVLVDAQTGETIKTLTYTSYRGGCGGGGYPPLAEAILIAHHSLRVDTFVWSPDQQSILVSQGCDDGKAEAVNVSTGAQTPNFPIGAHYQPGGNLLLGLWSDGTLGLTDLSANPVRALLKAPLTVPGYDISLGASTWSPDGKEVYFEHNNGIWRVNANGSGLRQLIAGTADDAQKNATAVFVPSLSPDGKLLLYAKARGSDNVDSAGTSPAAVAQWYVAQADGSHAAPLPQGVQEAAWRPAK
jgi:Tol biopolymer transport system component